MKIKPVRDFWMSVIFLVAGLAAILIWTGPIVEEGGTEIFDTRTSGYDLATARAILESLTDRAREMYLGPQRVADTAFPVGLLGTLAFGTIIAARRWSVKIGYALAVFPIAYFAFDMLENAGVATMIRMGADGITEMLVDRVSGFTIWKFRFVNAALVIFLLIWTLRGIAWAIDRRST
ncbi:hypothetical protein [Maritimibacter dapengensis]|uniref:DUF1772 domain-containing protein n=1 Tax=Maritimibacter dapengensis TaxID=2836868 RepID=A0ABS6SZZ1_9RHOB|nr:hypothetical protein [Maritimibacter dapengensis]MBV7378553.1 hypothetical protein [Maritimibacter dapengensis]